MAKPQSRVGSSIGVSGLGIYSGYVQDEWLQALAGPRGRKVIREMVDNDAVIGALLFSVTALVRSVEWTVTPGGDDQDHQDIADFIEDALGDMDVTFHDTLGEILTFLPWGWAIQELVYKRRDGVSSKYSDGRIGWQSWSLRGQESLMRWDVDASGTIQAMVQLGPPDWQEHVIPLAKCLHFRTTTERANPEGRSILRNAWKSWFEKKNIEMFQAIGIERDLAGLPVLYVPGEITEIQYDAQGNPLGDSQGFIDAKNIISSIRRGEQEGVVLPSDRDEHGQLRTELKLLTSGGTRQIDVEAVIARLDNRILMTAMADFITLGHDSRGSQALAQQRGEFFTTALDTWLGIIEAQINEVAIPRLLALNGIEIDEPPHIEHGDINRNDLQVVGQFLNFLATAGIALDTRVDGPLAQRLMGMARLPEPPDAEELQIEDPEAIPDQTQLPAPVPQQPGEPAAPTAHPANQMPHPTPRTPQARAASEPATNAEEQQGRDDLAREIAGFFDRHVKSA